MTTGASPVVGTLPPDSAAELRARHGQALLADGDTAGALAAFEAAADVAPDDLRFPLLAGVTAKRLGDLRRAAEHFQRVLALDAAHPDATAWLAAVIRELGHPEAGLRLAERALSLQPDHPDAMLAVANCRYDLDDTRGALAALDALRVAKGDSPNIAWNRGFFHLTLERFVEGWRDHEHRFAFASKTGDYEPRPGREWHGEPLEGRSIALTAEQGLGDQLMMLRFARGLRARGAACIVAEVERPIVALVRSCPYVDEVIPVRSPLPATDFVLPIGSLPHRLGVGSDLHGDAVPYLRAVGECPPALATALASSAPLKVGLVWGGEPRNASDRERSIPLAMFEPLLRLPGIAWYALQKGPKEAQLDDLSPEARTRLVNLSPFITDFTHTAHAIRRLDLVITVCTSVAHASGALGAPTWVLLRKAADWRWFRNRDDSPWYPTARLFRQRARGEWEPVLLDVARALVDRLRTGR